MRVLGVVTVWWAILLTLAGPGHAEAPVPIPEASPGTPAVMFTDTPDIVNAYPTRPQSWSRVADERVLRLHFATGTPECYGVSATVHESPTEVVVDLRTGTLPHAVDRACIAIGLFAALDVPLQEPLGSRGVLSLT